MNNELENTSTARIKLPKPVYKPSYINIEALESVREIIEIKKQRSDR